MCSNFFCRKKQPVNIWKILKEMNQYEADEDEVYFGANMTLNDVVEKEDFPLLSRVTAAIADHTIRTG